MTSVLISIISVLVTALIFTVGLLVKQSQAYRDLKTAFDVQANLLNEAKVSQQITTQVMEAVRTYIKPHTEVT